MSDTKKLYNKGLAELKESLANLELAEKSFAASSNSQDDFPTVRHEIMDVSKRIEKLKEKVAQLHDFAYDTRIQ
jgi:uncharacterized protein YwgA